MKTITDSLGRTEIVGDDVTDLNPAFRTNRQMMSAHILQSTKSAPYLRPQKSHVGAGAAKKGKHKHMYVHALKLAGIPVAKGSTWTAAQVKSAGSLAAKLFGQAAPHALAGFIKHHMIKAPASAVAGSTFIGRVRTGRAYGLSDDMTGRADVGRGVRTGRGYSLMDDMSGDDNVVDLAPGFRTNRQMMSAHILQSTKSAPYLRPQKTHVGDNVTDLAPGFRTNRQMMTAQILQSTKSAPYLRPQKTHVGLARVRGGLACRILVKKVGTQWVACLQCRNKKGQWVTKGAPSTPQPTSAAATSAISSRVKAGALPVVVAGSYFVGADAPPAIASQVPPPIPGEPADVLIALTAAANQLGVPPTAVGSMIAAKNSGDKKAAAEIGEAAKIYAAAQKGDKSAQDQIARVGADAKGKNPLALQKAAALAAAIGLVKGHKLFADRKHAADQQAAAQQRQQTVAAVAEPSGAPASSGFLDALMTFGGQPGPFMAYYQGTRPQRREI